MENRKLYVRVGEREEKQVTMSTINSQLNTSRRFLLPMTETPRSVSLKQSHKNPDLSRTIYLAKRKRERRVPSPNP